MKKGLPEIRESVSELKNLLRAEKKARRKERLQMLYLFRTGQAKTRKSGAQMLSVHRTTISCWLNAYARGGLDCMLHIGTKPNHKSSIPVHIFHSLKRKLRRRVGRRGGFKSYKSIKLWLEKRYSLSVPYSTVHSIVRYALRAKLKVGRKSHSKKNEKEGVAFKKNMPAILSYLKPLYGHDNMRLFSQDESRFGLLPILRRQITLPGIKPVSPVQFQFECYYLYGAAEPKTGESFFLELPNLNAQCFQIYLDEFSRAYADSFNVMLLDRGRFHQAKSLKIPHNVAIVFLPPYSPELNPIERLWEDIKAEIANELYPTMEALMEKVASVLKSYTKEMIQSITSYPYLMDAINGIIG
jgi:transposase